MPPTTLLRRADRGSASVWALAVGLAMLTAGYAGMSLGVAHVAAHQARTAADLGALAGAPLVTYGAEAACARAREVVTANGAELVRCRVVGLDLTVTVRVSPPAGAGVAAPAVATARAGPVRADDSRRRHSIGAT